MPILSSFEQSYRVRQAEFTREAWRHGVYDALRKPNEIRTCKNDTCCKYFQVKPHDKKAYCSSRCAAIVNNLKRPKKLKFCILCNQRLKSSGHNYCSNKCQNTHQHNLFIDRWKKGLEEGVKGINTRFLSGHIERYLKEKYKDACSMCGWSQKHSITGKVPLEIDHIDGNSENNREENLRMICPNCHSLTSSFRNLNKGKGRAWRIKYLKTLNNRS